MKTVAIVPVKGLWEAKGRLAGVLQPGERLFLARDMLHHVLSVLAASGAVDKVAVVSPDPGSLDLPGSVAPLQQRRSGLNNGLEEGREWALGEGADALMVLFADLPLLSPDNIVDIVELGTPNGTLVLAPDRHQSGTNVMLAHPPMLARFAFGLDSYRKHMEEGREGGAHLQIYRDRGTALDIDTPDDLALLDREKLLIPYLEVAY